MLKTEHCILIDLSPNQTWNKCLYSESPSEFWSVCDELFCMCFVNMLIKVLEFFASFNGFHLFKWKCTRIIHVTVYWSVRKKLWDLQIILCFLLKFYVTLQLFLNWACRSFTWKEFNRTRNIRSVRQQNITTRKRKNQDNSECYDRLTINDWDSESTRTATLAKLSRLYCIIYLRQTLSSLA